METSRLTKEQDYPQLRGSLAHIRYPALAEAKFDGEFNHCYIHTPAQDECWLINKGGRTRSHFPVTDSIKQIILKPAVLIGELCHGMGAAGALYDLLKNQESDDLHFMIFDIIMYDNESLSDWSLMDRLELLGKLLSSPPVDGTGLYISKPRMMYSEKDVTDLFKRAVEQKLEGIVVKNLHSRFMYGPCDWVKIKAKDTSDFKVIMIDPNAERIGIEAKTPTGHMSWIEVGVKVPDKEKKLLNLGDIVHIEYQGILPSGSLRHPVFRGKV